MKNLIFPMICLNQKIRTPLLGLLLCTGAAVFVLSPTQSFQAALGDLQPIRFIIALLCLAICSALVRVTEKTSPRLVARTTLLRRVVPLTAALVFLVSATQISSPLDVDENVHAYQIARGDIWREINPFFTSINQGYQQNHSLSQLASILSMRIFGFDKIGLRLPALFFTALGFWFVLVVGRQVLRPLTLLFVFLHFGANQNLLWYNHSSRGYGLMVLMSLSAFLLVYATIQGIQIRHFKYWSLTLFLGLPLTHLFGGVFSCLLAMTYYFWLQVKKTETSQQQKDLIRAFLWSCPLLAAVFICKVLYLKSIGDLNVSTDTIKMDLAPVLGLSRSWAFDLALFFVVTQLALKWRSMGTRLFPVLFLCFSYLALAILVEGLSVRLLLPRFLLGFAPIIVIALIDNIPPIRKAAPLLAIYGILLLLLPLYFQSEIRSQRIGGMTAIDPTVKAVRNLLTENDCLKISGKEDVTAWMKTFYLKEPNQNCNTLLAQSKTYHLFIPPFEEKRPHFGQSKVLKFKQNGFLIYEEM